MTRYLMSVFGPAEYSEYGNYPSEEAMKQAMADTDVSTSDSRTRVTGCSLTAWHPQRPRRSSMDKVPSRLSPTDPTWNPRNTSAASGSSRLQPRRGAEAGRRRIERLPGQGRGASVRGRLTLPIEEIGAETIARSTAKSGPGWLPR
jgi:hypothetical protein